MLRSIRTLVSLVLLSVLCGCAPPPELTASEEELVRHCLELGFKQETAPECAPVTRPMQKAFLDKHPDFYERLVAERKAFVEARIAEDVRRRETLNQCVDAHEAGSSQPPACEKFTAHEIERAIEDRRLRRCAQARLDGLADAQQHCEGWSERDIEDEVRMERVRRESRRQSRRSGQARCSRPVLECAWRIAGSRRTGWRFGATAAGARSIEKHRAGRPHGAPPWGASGRGASLRPSHACRGRPVAPQVTLAASWQQASAPG